MRKRPLASLLFALVGGTAQSCGGNQSTDVHRYVTRRPTEKIQHLVDRCVSETGDPACDELCREVFQEQGGPDPGTCRLETSGAESTIRVQITYVTGGENPQGCGPGRRPAGLRCAPARGASPIADHLAWAAQLEAASVTAFARIHRELVAWGAADDLRARVRRAVADEIEHAQVMAELARRAGARPTAPVIVPGPPVTVLERALDNAVEGCVGEAVAALHAAYMAVRCGDSALRDAFTKIAVDESHHAVLAYDLARFYARHLSGADNARVDALRHAAAARAIATAPSAGMIALGIPSGRELATSTAALLSRLGA